MLRSWSGWLKRRLSGSRAGRQPIPVRQRVLPQVEALESRVLLDCTVINTGDTGQGATNRCIKN
jgi:hypothetical protein